MHVFIKQRFILDADLGSFCNCFDWLCTVFNFFKSVRIYQDKEKQGYIDRSELP